MDADKAAALRAPFPPAAIGKLPKPYRADSQKGTCKECGGYHGMPAVHLDYVGHAATTDRLLQVDPGWSWEPLANDANGLPALDSKGNLWIRLTVAGVTRIGVGDGKSAKECIGDAIRNAAMRFGVALDLWAKEDLHEGCSPVPVASELPPAPRQVSGPAAAAARDELRALLVAKDIPLGEALVMFRAAHEGDDLPTTTDVPAIRALIEHYTAEVPA